MNATLDPRRVRQSFAAAAASYAEFDGLQREVAARLDERLDLLRIEPRRILDLGCGPGRQLQALSSRYPRARLTALDAAGGMLRACPRRLGWRRRIDRVCGDARALPLADGTQDLVWSNLALPWIEPPADALAEVARVLDPEGVLLFSSFGPDTLAELRQSWASVDDEPHVNRFDDMHDLGDALVRCGFTDPVMDSERLTVTYRDVRHLMTELKALGASNAALARRRSLTGKRRLASMTRYYETHFRQGDRIEATWEVVYGVAWGVPPGRPRATAGGQVASVPVEALKGSRRGRS